jgi:formylglycine-generating enzyme required for sulfatase activity
MKAENPTQIEKSERQNYPQRDQLYRGGAFDEHKLTVYVLERRTSYFPSIRINNLGFRLVRNK